MNFFEVIMMNCRNGFLLRVTATVIVVRKLHPVVSVATVTEHKHLLTI